MIALLKKIKQEQKQVAVKQTDQQTTTSNEPNEADYTKPQQTQKPGPPPEADIDNI